MDSRALREALRKQGIFVHESDPVLDVAAICELAMADTLKAIEAMVKAAADRTSAASCQAIEAAKTNGEAVVTQGAAFIVGQFRETVREATATMLAELRQETIRAENASCLADPGRLGRRHHCCHRACRHRGRFPRRLAPWLRCTYGHSGLYS